MGGRPEANHFCRLISSGQRWPVLQTSVCECLSFNFHMQHASREAEAPSRFKSCILFSSSLTDSCFFLLFPLLLVIYPFLSSVNVSTSRLHLLLSLSLNRALIHPHFSHSVSFSITFFSHLSPFTCSFLSLNSLLLPCALPPCLCNSLASLLAPSAMTMKGTMPAAQPKPRSCHSGHWTEDTGMCVVQKNEVHRKHTGRWWCHAYAYKGMC